jgi:uncharacterized membrane protein YccF (DUF307 family)
MTKGDAPRPTAPSYLQQAQPPIIEAYPVNESFYPQQSSTTTTTVRTLSTSDDSLSALPYPVILLLNGAWLFLFGGIFVCAIYLVASAIFCVTIVGIPCGLQLFKLFQLACFPFGTAIDRHFQQSSSSAITTSGSVACFCTFLANLVWIPIGALLLFIHLAAALIGTVSIVGIPFAYVHFRMASLAICPFGADLICGGGSSREEIRTTTVITDRYQYEPV